MQFHIYYINLNSRKDRNEHMKQVLNIFDVLNIKYERIEAINGADINLNDLINSNIINKNVNLTRGQIGCALSHILAWTKFIESDYKFGIFFEDDIITNKKYFDDIFVNAIKTIENIDFDWCYLGSNIMSDVEYYNATDINKYFYKLHKFPYGAHAYILTKNGAQKLINYFKKVTIWHPLDFIFRIEHDYYRLFNQKFNIISIKPDMIYYNSFDKQRFKYECGKEFLFYAKNWSDSDTGTIK